MKTVDQIIDAMSPAVLAAGHINALPDRLRPRGKSILPNLIHQWRCRKRIPQEWFPALLAASREHEWGITQDDLIYHVIQNTHPEPHRTDKVAA